MIASGGAQRSASSQTMIHTYGVNPAAAEPLNALRYQQQLYQQQLQESEQQRKRRQMKQQQLKQQQLKQQQQRLQQQGEEEQQPLAACPSPVLDISEASVLLLRTAATAKHNEAAASIALLAGIPLPLEYDTAAAAAAAAAARNGGGGGGGSGQASGTEEEGEDSPTQYSDLEEFELFMTAAQRANGGGPGGKGGKKEDMGPLRFHDDPKWYFVHCAVPWTGQVGITVVNATLPVGGRHRHVLSVSAVAEEGSGYRAGVRAGDCITKVEGRDVTGMPCAELMSTLRDLLQARKQIDPSVTLEFIFARNLSRESTRLGTKAGAVATAAGAAAPSSSSSSLSACTSNSSIITTESSEPHVFADTISRGSSGSTSTDNSCASSSSSSSSSSQLVGVDSSSSVASATASVAAISLAGTREGEMDIDDKSEEGKAKGHHHKTKASGTVNLDEVGDGGKEEEEEEEMTVVEKKQNDGREGESGESGRRRLRERGSAEKESPSKRRLRRTASTSGVGMDEEEQQQQQEQQKSSGDGTYSSQSSPARSSRMRVPQGSSEEQSAVGEEMGTLAWARFEKLPKWPCRIEKVVEEPVKEGGKEGGEEVKQMAVVHFFGDVGPEKVPVASLERFETNFKRLYKRRHEKIYVRAVSQAVVHLTTQKGLDATQLGALLDVPPRTLEVYMQDAARHKMLNSGSKRRVHHRTASQGEGEGEEAGAREGAGSAAGKKLSPYHVDPDQLHDTKKTGIFTEAWFDRRNGRG